jgi:hypothetical protein
MARYKRETLEAKSVRELRQLVVKLGIKGKTKLPKNSIIDAIMDGGGGGGGGASVAPKPAQLSGIEGTFQSTMTKPGESFGHKTSTTIQVSCGASSGRFPVAGRSLAEVGEFLREVLNVSKLSTGMVNGKEAEGSYVVKDGDVIEFLKPAGKKG